MLKIKNIEQLQILKNKNWNKDYTLRDFQVNTIEEFKYLLKNYLNKFAFGVEYDNFKYTIFKEDENICVRNDDTYEFKDSYEPPVSNAYHIKSSIDNVLNFVKSQKENEKRRIRIKFINIELEEETKEIKKLLSKGIIKYFYDDSEPLFMYLAENEKEILNILDKNKIEYYIREIVNQLNSMFCDLEVTIKNVWDDEITLPSDRIVDLISDELYTYIPQSKQKEIFENENPYKKLREIFNEIGRNQLKMQIESLLEDLNSWKKVEFK